MREGWFRFKAKGKGTQFICHNVVCNVKTNFRRIQEILPGVDKAVRFSQAPPW